MKLIVSLYTNSIRRLTSFIINAFYTLFIYPKNKMRVDSEINRLKANVHSMDDIVKESKAFQWVSDPLGGFIDWSPVIKTFIIRNKKDDCDGAAMYAKYLASLCDYEAKIIALTSEKPFITDSHVVCAINYFGRTVIFSNGEKLGDFDSIMSFIKWYNTVQPSKYFLFYNIIDY